MTHNPPNTTPSPAAGSNYHEPDQDGWCQNTGCDWNVWNSPSNPDCPVNFGGKKAGTVQEQEDMLSALRKNKTMTTNTIPDGHEVELRRRLIDIGLRHKVTNAYGQRFIDFGACVDDMMQLISAHTETKIREARIDERDRIAKLYYELDGGTFSKVLAERAEELAQPPKEES